MGSAAPPLVIGVLADSAYTCCTVLVLVGVNVNWMLQLAPAASVAPQLVATAYGELTEPRLSVTAAVVEFDSTTPYVGDVVPTATVPKLWPAVVRETPPLVVPDPVSVPPFDGA